MMSQEARAAQNAYMREYRAKNREKVSKWNRTYREKNQDKLREYRSRYWERKAAEAEKEKS